MSKRFIVAIAAVVALVVGGLIYWYAMQSPSTTSAPATGGAAAAPGAGAPGGSLGY